MASHVIISGGSSGIGLALARKLAGQGWNLTLLARSADLLERARTDIQRTGAVVRTASVDVRDAQAVQIAILAAIDALGAPSLVVTSAGIVLPGLFHELDPEAYRSTMEVNYFGTLNVVRAALPAMRMRRSGQIALISSGAGLIGLYGYTAYAPSKFAVRGLGEALRAELAPDGIGVSVVYPPDTDTPQLREEVRMRPQATSKIAGGARTHSADDVADAILEGLRKHRFTIAPGWEMATLARLHSLLGPLLNRFSFDPIVARYHGKKTAVET